ncbi:MAG: OsmC family protein [Planctomycetota bacterium]
MVQIEARYDGSLRCSAVHGPSSSSLETDAPADNMGKGEKFSPTDLVATALATCILTTVAIVAERNEYDITGMTASVEKHMAADPHRRIARLPVTLRLPGSLHDTARKKLEHAAEHCPVHHSLGAGVDAPIEFVYG